MSHQPSLFEAARARANDASGEGDLPRAARWAERAWRLSGRRPLASLELAAVLARVGDDRATELLRQAAEHHADFPVLIALAASQNRNGACRSAQATLQRLLTTVALDVVPPVAALASEIAAWAGLQGWLGWRKQRLLFGPAHGSPDTMEFTLDRRRLVLDWVPEAPRLWSASLPPGARSLLRATPPLLGAPLRPELFLTPAGSIAQDATRVRGWVWFPHDPERQPGVAITIARRGRRSEIAIQDLSLLEPIETEPFARRWGFDLTVPVGATVVQAKEVGSNCEIPLERQQPRPMSGAPAADIPTASDRLTRHCQSRECVLLVTHDEGGGIERHLQHRLAALRRLGKIGLLLRSQQDQPGSVRLELDASAPGEAIFRLPSQSSELLGLLRTIAPIRIEFHQPRRHDDLIWQLAASLGLPYDVYLHDYALLCPRVTLIGADGAYCGEPPVAHCERCVESFEHRHLLAPAGVAALRRRSAALLSQARLVRAPSADIARRFRRHMPGTAVAVRPWEAAKPSPARTTRFSACAHVCVVGALNDHKGFGILLDCARDAAIQGLPIRFTVVGHTIDDAALIGAGAFVTGPYLDAERESLIARQQATVGFLPSIWPEPWCYSLTGLLDAGLPTLCFDVGAQADRVRAVGGSILPLGTPAHAINQRILKLHRCMMNGSAAIVAPVEPLKTVRA